jgi:pyrroline-5-carboxylate reductase
VTGISPGAHCGAQALTVVAALMSSVGEVVEVPERLQDAVTAVSGSGPAYVFYLAEAMTTAAIELGLDADTAARMVNHTILGAATLLNSADEPAEELRRNVTSPHGTTAAAIDTMEVRGVRDGIVAGVSAARDRSRELSGA